ncbi:MAG: hypothetical protein WA123_09405 [Methylotenera sp.]
MMNERYLTQRENQNDLTLVLEEFTKQINSLPSMRSTLNGWHPEFYIQERDTGYTYEIQIENSLIRQILLVSTEPSDDALLMRADYEILHEIFSGTLSPLGAYTDGLLEVYGNQKDQIKLDVIALTLWGA